MSDNDSDPIDTPKRMPRIPDHRRREFLVGAGIAGVSALAGCPESGDTDSDQDLVTDGGGVQATAIEIDGNVVTLTLHNNHDAPITLSTVELESTSEVEHVDDVQGQTTPVVDGVTTSDTDVVGAVEVETTSVVESLTSPARVR